MQINTHLNKDKSTWIALTETHLGFHSFLFSFFFRSIFLRSNCFSHSLPLPVKSSCFLCSFCRKGGVTYCRVVDTRYKKLSLVYEYNLYKQSGRSVSSLASSHLYQPLLLVIRFVSSVFECLQQKLFVWQCIYFHSFYVCTLTNTNYFGMSTHQTMNGISS